MHNQNKTDVFSEIQRLMRSEKIAVQLLGDEPPSKRNALRFIAGQALQKQIQGFGFEEIEGKFMLNASMREMVKLHKEAARAVGEETARIALNTWAVGETVGKTIEWIPDSVQRLLMNSISVDSAASIVEAIKSGAVGQHASDFGSHGFAAALAEQGIDVNAKTVAMQAEELGLVVVEPNRERGQYIGSCVGHDHRAALVKFNRNHALELPFKLLEKDQERLTVGHRVRIGFKNYALTISVAQNVERSSLGR